MFSPATTAPSRDVTCNYPLMNSLALTCNWPISDNVTISEADRMVTMLQVRSERGGEETDVAASRGDSVTETMQSVLR